MSSALLGCVTHQVLNHEVTCPLQCVKLIQIRTQGLRHFFTGLGSKFNRPCHLVFVCL
eukprot:SAG31_NODE_31496_length_367_cov_1.156716_1_plen_57_part_10